MNIVETIIKEAVTRHNKAVESFLLKELSKMGHNFDSYELRDLFFRTRLRIAVREGINYLYLDGHLVTAWKNEISFVAGLKRNNGSNCKV